MGARPYDPNLGRFLAVDPVDGGSLNNYDYGGQDPVNGYDLSGSRLDESEAEGEPAGIAMTCGSTGIQACSGLEGNAADWTSWDGSGVVDALKNGIHWIGDHPGEALDLALAGGGTGCMIVMFANPLAGAFCELDVGAVKVTVNMLWDRKQNGAATVGGVACAVGGEVSAGLTQTLNEFCDGLATTVENLMSYGGRH